MINTETPFHPKAEVLLVEDNDADADLTREGFAHAHVPVRMHHVRNGEECLAFLRKQGDFCAAPTPDLVLLDLNMPVMDGREVLAAIANDDSLKHLPVVVLTTSAAEHDVMDMYRLRCSAYLTKPVQFDRFQQLIETLSTYWFEGVVLPARN